MDKNYSKNKHSEHSVKGSMKGKMLYLVDGDCLLATLAVEDSAEGKYSPELPKAYEDFNFLVEATSHQWMLICTSQMRIVMNNEMLADRTPLPENGIIRLVSRNRKMMVFVLSADQQSSFTQRFRILDCPRIQIGRQESMPIELLNPIASRKHAIMTKRDTRFVITDIQSSFGVFVNGIKIQEKTLELGDVVQLPGVKIVIGLGFFTVSSDNHNCKINGLPAMKQGDLNGLDWRPALKIENEIFFRKPRTRSFRFNSQDISVDAPPAQIGTEKIPLALRFGGPAVYSGVSAMSGHFTSMISSVLFPMLTSKYTDKQKKEYEERRVRKYTRYLQQKVNEIEQIRLFESKDLNENNPSALELSTYIAKMYRLWERRPLDPDFLKLRIGTGSQKLKSKIQYPERTFGMDEDPLMMQMISYMERDYSIADAPIVVDFFENYICGFKGGPGQRESMFLTLLFELCYLHAPSEVKVILLAPESFLERYPSLRYIPHIWDEERDFRFIASSFSECMAISSKLVERIEENSRHNSDRHAVLKNAPYYFVFSFSLPLLSAVTAFEKVLQSEKNIGFTILSFSDSLPNSCIQLFDLEGINSTVLQLLHQDEQDVHFTQDEMDFSWVNAGFRKMANLKIPVTDQKKSLPDMLTFLEMMGAGKVEHLSILKRWQESNPMKSLATPVGVNPDGSLFYLDLHEKQHGPHGLIAGMTGSGKSEFIISYILSMAVNYHPDEVSFVLIDFKGGGLTGAFEDKSRGIRLPHLAGTITNLDGNTMQRALISIESELKRRQAIFLEARSIANEGTMDIYSYQQLYRSGVVKEPVSHLFIISDEFAELKSQQPEFMDQLISTARIGRSLGVHLILATQKPAGVVNDQIWSNSKFKVCLKVQDRADSMEMIKRPEAAEIKETGRFYLQVGYNEFFALGQSAWTGAPYEPSDRVVKKKENEISFLDWTGQTVFRVKPTKKKNKKEIPQLVSIMKHLTELAAREQVASRPLWKEPLPRMIDLDTIEKTDQKYLAVAGMVDDPVHQQQMPLQFSILKMKNLLITGEAGSGKSTLLQMLLLSLLEHTSPDDLNLYILDLPGKSMGAFKEAKHVGAVFQRPEFSTMTRVTEKISDILEERKNLFMKLRLNKFEDVQNQMTLPLILLVIDGFDEMPDDREARELKERLVTLARTGPAYGIQMIIVIQHHQNLPVRLRMEMNSYLPLHLKESYHYFDLFGKRPTIIPEILPGRGLVSQNDQLLEFQTAIFKPKETENARQACLIERIRKANLRYIHAKLPEQIVTLNRKQTYSEFIRFFKPERVPLGILQESVKPVLLPLQQMFTLTLYFGNREAEATVIDNWQMAAKMNDAQSVYVGAKVMKEAECQRYRLTDEGIEDFIFRIKEEIVHRTAVRKEICHEMEIDDWKTDESRKAWRKEMRRRVKPLFVYLDGLASVAGCLNEEQYGILNAFFATAAGYHIYVAASFYPDDQELLPKLSSQEQESGRISAKQAYLELKTFFSRGPGLLIGGLFSDQDLYRLPVEYSRFSSSFSKQQLNQVLLVSGGRTAKLLLPMGDLEVIFEEDEDDLPII